MTKVRISEKNLSKILNKGIDFLYNNPDNSIELDYDLDKKIADEHIEYLREGNDEIPRVLQNFRSYIEEGIKYQEGYIAVVKKDLNTFKNSSFAKSLLQIIYFHFRQQLIMGRKDYLEPQIADKSISNDIAQGFVDLEKLKYEIAILIKQSIVKHQPKQTLENITRRISIFNKETYLQKRDKLVKTHTFNKERFYKTSALKLWEISILKGKCSIMTYPLPKTKVSEIQFDNLSPDICFVDTNYFEKDSFNEKLTYDVFSEVIFNEYKKVYSLHFDNIEKLKTKNEYKKFIAENLLSAINKHYNHLSQHAKNIMVGYILSELEIIRTKDEHIDSKYKSSYKDYLNKTVSVIWAEKEKNEKKSE